MTKSKKVNLTIDIPPSTKVDELTILEDENDNSKEDRQTSAKPGKTKASWNFRKKLEDSPVSAEEIESSSSSEEDISPISSMSIIDRKTLYRSGATSTKTDTQSFASLSSLSQDAQTEMAEQNELTGDNIDVYYFLCPIV